jgi:flagellar FliL protein
MAVDVETGEGAKPEETGNGRKKLLIFGGAAAAVVLVAGAGLYFYLSSAQGAADHAVAAVEETFIFNLPPMMVNLNTEGDEAEAFMRVTIALEVANEEVMHEIQPSLAKVIDAFQVYLRELRRSDLEGSAGIYRLKEELLRRVNVAIYPSRVESILFKELLVQ